MLKRLWLLLSILWALLLFGVFASDSSNTMSGGFLFTALGPLAAGWALPPLIRFVRTGSFARPRVTVYRGR